MNFEISSFERTVGYVALCDKILIALEIGQTEIWPLAVFYNSQVSQKPPRTGPSHAQLRWLLELIALRIVHENLSALCRKLGGPEKTVSPMYCDTFSSCMNSAMERGGGHCHAVVMIRDWIHMARLPSVAAIRPANPPCACAARAAVSGKWGCTARLRCGHTDSAVNTRRTNQRWT